MGGCQKCGPFLGTLNIRGRIIIGIQKGTIILTTTHMKSVKGVGLFGLVAPESPELSHSRFESVLVQPVESSPLEGSSIRGAPLQIPKYHHPFYGDPCKKVPLIFGTSLKPLKPKTLFAAEAMHLGPRISRPNHA